MTGIVRSPPGITVCFKLQDSWRRRNYLLPLLCPGNPPPPLCTGSDVPWHSGVDSCSTGVLWHRRADPVMCCGTGHPALSCCPQRTSTQGLHGAARRQPLCVPLPSCVHPSGPCSQASARRCPVGGKHLSYAVLSHCHTRPFHSGGVGGVSLSLWAATNSATNAATSQATNLASNPTTNPATNLAPGGGGGDAKACFFVFLDFMKAVVFFGHLLHPFFSHVFCLQFPFIVAIHGQICLTCIILTVGGGVQMHLFAFFLHRIFRSLHLHSPPPSGASNQRSSQPLRPNHFPHEDSGAHCHHRSRRQLPPSAPRRPQRETGVLRCLCGGVGEAGDVTHGGAAGCPRGQMDAFWAYVSSSAPESHQKGFRGAGADRVCVGGAHAPPT